MPPKGRQILQEKNKDQFLDIKIKNMEEEPPQIARARYVTIPPDKEITKFIHKQVTPIFDEINRLLDQI